MGSLWTVIAREETNCQVSFGEQLLYTRTRYPSCRNKFFECTFFSTMSKVKFPCGECNKTTSGSYAIKCAVCEKWVHRECDPSLTEALFDHLTTLKEVHKIEHHWSCTQCRGILSEFNKRLKQVEVKVGKLEKRADTQDDKIEVVSKKLDKVEDSVDDLKKQKKEDTNKVIQQSSDQVFKELAEMKAKELNLIVHNLPEPGANIKKGMDRKDKDLKTLGDLATTMKTTLNPETDLKFSARAGELDLASTDPEKKPRPMILGFKTLEKKEEFLKAAYNLKATKYEMISIVADLTSRQRRLEKEMRDECKEKNEELDKTEEGLNWIWKVVGPRGQRQLRKVPREDPQTAQPKAGQPTYNNPNYMPPGRGRGRGRGRGGPAGRGATGHRETRASMRALSPTGREPSLQDERASTEREPSPPGTRANKRALSPTGREPSPQDKRASVSMDH